MLEYSIFFIKSVPVLITFWLMSPVLFMKFSKDYREKTQGERDYHDSLMANICFVVVLLARLVYFFGTVECDAVDGVEHKSWVESTGWKFEQMTNDACFASVDKFAVKNLVWSMAHFVVDIVLMVFF